MLNLQKAPSAKSAKRKQKDIFGGNDLDYPMTTETKITEKLDAVRGLDETLGGFIEYKNSSADDANTREANIGDKNAISLDLKDFIE